MPRARRCSRSTSPMIAPVPGPIMLRRSSPTASASTPWQRGPRRGAPVLGDGTKAVLDCERDVRRVSRQSLTAVRDLPAGHRLERADLVIRRPGLGLSPGALDFVLGRALARGVAQGACLRAADIAEPGPH